MPQIIILTETWFSNENAWNLEGYASYHTIRPNRRSGGVSDYVNNNLASNKLQIYAFVTKILKFIPSVLLLTIHQNFF